MAADSEKRSLLIQEGTAQCSLGISSGGSVSVLSHCDLLRDVGFRGRAHTVVAFRFGGGLCLFLELVCERNVVEEGPGVVEFGVPGSFEVNHRLYHAVDLLVPDQ
jgi:hypothetical protein